VTRSKPPSPDLRVRGGRSELWHWAIRGSGLAIGALGVLLVAYLLQASLRVLVLVIISLLLAAALDPLVESLRMRLPLSRVKVIGLVYVCLVALAVLLVLLMVPAAIDELDALSSRLPTLISEAKDWAATVEPAAVGSTIERALVSLERTVLRGGTSAAAPEDVVQFGLTAADAAITVVTVLTMVFFWLISRETMQRFSLSLLPHDQRRSVRDAWNEIEHRLGYWFRGQLTLMAVIGVLTTVAYFVLGLENALLLGIFAGFAEVIPIVGPAIGALPALASAFVSGGPELALLVAAVYIVIQVLEGQILVPMIMRNAVGLPPFVVIVALLVGAAVAGLIGALLAVPVAAAIAVVLERAQARVVPVAMDTPRAPEPEPDPPPADAGDEPPEVPVVAPAVERR
jgi:predicted PurR-regulated permease PerM